MFFSKQIERNSLEDDAFSTYIRNFAQNLGIMAEERKDFNRIKLYMLKKYTTIVVP